MIWIGLKANSSKGFRAYCSLSLSSQEHGLLVAARAEVTDLSRVPVYRFGGKQLTEAQLSEWLQVQSEVRVFEGLPEYDDYYHDEVSRQSFDHHFVPSDDILFLPSTDGTLAKALGFPKINYTERLEVALRTPWGAFEEWEDDDRRVGDVDGVFILRLVTRYGRPATG